MKAGLRRVGSAADGGRGLLDQVRYDLRLRDIDGVAGGDRQPQGRFRHNFTGEAR